MRQKSAVPAAGLALMGLGFALGACEYVTVVILPDIAADLGVSLGAAGWLVSVFAAGYAVGTPILMAATARLPRFRLLMGAAGAVSGGQRPQHAGPGTSGCCHLGPAASAMLTGTLTAVGLLFAGSRPFQA